MSKSGSSKSDDTPRQWKPKVADGPKFELLPKHKKELYEIFEMLDDGSGVIKVKDVQAAFKTLNYIPDDMEMKRLFKGIKTEKISVEDFVTIMQNKLSEEDNTDDLKRVFSYFDYDRKGYITFANLSKIANDMHIDVSDEEMKEMIDEADLDRDNKVSLEEFIKIMLKVNY